MVQVGRFSFRGGDERSRCILKQIFLVTLLRGVLFFSTLQILQHKYFFWIIVSKVWYSDHTSSKPFSKRAVGEVRLGNLSLEYLLIHLRCSDAGVG